MDLHSLLTSVEPAYFKLAAKLFKKEDFIKELEKIIRNVTDTAAMNPSKFYYFYDSNIDHIDYRNNNKKERLYYYSRFWIEGICLIEVYFRDSETFIDLSDSSYENQIWCKSYPVNKIDKNYPVHQRVNHNTINFIEVLGKLYTYLKYN